MIKSLEKPIHAFIRNRYLQDMDPKVEGFTPVEIIGFSSYPGHVLTTEVLVNGSALFSYIPLMALSLKEDTRELQIGSTYYFNCPGGDFSFHELTLLKDREVFIFDKKGTLIDGGTRNKYIMTIDWPEDNQSVHIISANGPLIAWPSHKLLFKLPYAGVLYGLPQFKKLRREWKL